MSRMIRVNIAGSGAVRAVAAAILLILTGRTAVSASPVVVSEDLSLLNVSGHLEYLEDRSGALAIEQVRDAAGPPLAWKANRRDYVNFGYTTSAYWFRLTLSNPRGIAGRMLLEIDFPGLNHVDMYSPDGRGGYRVIRTGNLLPFSNRAIRDRNFIFPIQMQKGDAAYFIRISNGSSFRFRANLYCKDTFLEIRDYYNSLLWFIYGMALLTGVFYMFLFIFMRDRVYLYYFVSVLMMFVHQITLRGFAPQYLWPSYPRTGMIIYPLLLSGMGIFPGLFIRAILDTSATSRLIDRIFSLFAYVIFPASALVSFFVPYRHILRADYYLLMVYCLLVVITAVYYLGKGNRFARYLLAGIASIGITGVLTMFTALGGLPATSSMEWSIEIGFLLLVLFSSLGLVDRFWIMNRDLMNSERCLQEKNVVLTRINEELRSSLEEKIALIREVHDRVKNNMQVVCSMLNLQVRSFSNPETMQALNDAVERIYSMASIHERIYQTGNFSRVDMGAYIEDLSRHLVSQYANTAGMKEPIRMVYRLSRVLLPVDTAIPFGLIIGELLTNAIKHGCRGTTDAAIELSIECSEGTLTLVIADNGPGMDKELVGTYNNVAIGLQIVDVLSRQIGAVIDVNADHGTRITVRVDGCDAGGDA